MINFIGNALKFTSNGFIYILLSDFDSYSIMVSIIDTGKGISKDK